GTRSGAPPRPELPSTVAWRTIAVETDEEGNISRSWTFFVGQGASFHFGLHGRRDMLVVCNETECATIGVDQHASDVRRFVDPRAGLAKLYENLDEAEYLGERTIDDAPAYGWRTERSSLTIEAWIDGATSVPRRISVETSTGAAMDEHYFDLTGVIEITPALFDPSLVEAVRDEWDPGPDPLELGPEPGGGEAPEGEALEGDHD
ncbi:MAG TPA: hypothetical protein VK116_19330, partial [Planctomycetota bacterium]|nr:hypothetical protein [Planctomycetota bacterium]